MRITYLTTAVTAAVIFFGSMLGRSEPSSVKSQITQQPAEHLKPLKNYMSEGVIEHADAIATLKVNAPQPLRQAVATLNLEYGWMIDFEDPPYMSDSELIDITDPKRRAANPNYRATMLAGGGFEFQYEENSLDTDPQAVQALLHRLVAAYNQSGNPGKFKVRRQESGRYTIIGSSVKNHSGRDEAVDPILDTLISVPVERRRALHTIDLILRTLSAKTNKKVEMGWSPNNLFFSTWITVGGDNVSARSLLVQALNSTGRPVVYDLMYSESIERYIFRSSLAVRAYRDTFGKKTLIPLDSKPRGPR
jgi:hypothetical protein